MAPPSMLGNPCPTKTRADLEWDRLLGALADRCQSAVGKRRALGLDFATSLEEIRVRFAEASEAIELLRLAEPVGPGDIPDVEPAIERLRVGATLALGELRDVSRTLEAARGLRKFLSARKARCPALFAACSPEASLDEVAAELASCFDPDGSLSDRASPRLGELRAERRAGRDRLVRRLEELIEKHAAILQDTYWTERDGRYVLPVRADAHERFFGIVHGTSDSGRTLFVEPRSLVAMGNRQKMLDGMVAHEEERVLARLSARIADLLDAFARAVEALAHADLCGAIARLAKDLGLVLPELVVEGSGEEVVLELVAARHPLLVLDGVSVVPSDLSIRSRRAMVVSGPNAGGKTVCLKTLGLAALMVRAGLPVCASEGSRASAFDVVLTDVGDDQSLAKNLSTFSAHVRNLASILDQTRPGALVLLDELAGGTDPREGEALAAAVLDSLCARGGAVACTTHYEGLKLLAHEDPRFDNASVGFDLATMSPTFRVHAGVPGSSAALAVARRLGIPGPVVERAERFLGQEVRGFDEVARALLAERRALELAREEAKREADAMRERRSVLDREIERLTAKERRTITREGEALLESLQRARESLRLAQAKLRAREPTLADLKEAERAIDAIAKKTALGGELEPLPARATEERPAIQPSEIRVGMRVWVPKLRAEAEVVEVLPSGQLRVAAGPLKLTTLATDVRAASPRETPSPGRASRTGSVLDAASASDPDVPIQTRDNTVDLRGLRTHEAVSLAEQFLDRSIGAGRRVAFLIHGHGTGALRETLRETLEKSRYVTHIRPGGPREGGDGVTVVWLR